MCRLVCIWWFVDRVAEAPSVIHHLISIVCGTIPILVPITLGSSIANFSLLLGIHRIALTSATVDSATHGIRFLTYHINGDRVFTAQRGLVLGEHTARKPEHALICPADRLAAVPFAFALPSPQPQRGGCIKRGAEARDSRNCLMAFDCDGYDAEIRSSMITLRTLTHDGRDVF
ncbi:hypothetical protein EWM64_g8278 [Hericium alpestre]|uniref:Uncharacterized protein n=1 Tax=Hericium alpestre TaxID=135208 RepID=A0A4Y9ZN96_9AGAM|nr:hypothetical protein EWM64_g8278 [Hericium alpestre]